MFVGRRLLQFLTAWIILRIFLSCFWFAFLLIAHFHIKAGLIC